MLILKKLHQGAIYPQLRWIAIPRNQPFHLYFRVPFSSPSLPIHLAF
jgi:hypothetical protein